MKHFCVPFIFLFCFLSVKGQENNTEISNQTWLLVCFTEKGDSTYMKSEYHTKTNEGIKVWVKSILRTKKINEITYKNVIVKMLFVFDCENNRIKPTQLIINSSSGEVLTSETIKEYKQSWQDVIPDSCGEQIFKKACSLFSK